MSVKQISFFFLFLINAFTSYAEESIYEIHGKKISYQDSQNLIVATGDAYAKDQLGKEIYANKISYDKKKLTILTTEQSIYLDNKGNRLEADQFFYDINLKKIKATGNVNYFTKEGDHFKFSSFEYYEGLQKGSGENFAGKLSDESLMEGPIAEINQAKGIIIINKSRNKLYNYFTSLFGKEKRNSYTPCINKESLNVTIEEKCSDWKVTSSQTTHDKNKKMLYHEGVLVHIRNIPVFYTPYFSHPDPTVKRKSGFLPPTIKNFTNLGRSLRTPYFMAIDKSSDLTFTPIYYNEENAVFLGEYRQSNKNSEMYIDTSYSEGYKKLTNKASNRTPGSRSHFFFNLLGNYENLLLSSSDLEINFQKISQKNYLKVHQINTEYVDQGISALQNNIILNSYEGSKKVGLEAHVYENLNEDNSAKKYNYTLPAVTFSNFINKFNQSINFNNSFSAKNLGEDINQIQQTNQIEIVSDLKKTKLVNGMGNIFKTSVKNINLYNENVENAKENLNSDSYLILAMENSYPLVKYSNKNKTEQTISPIVFSKYTTGSMSNSSTNDKKLIYEDIFSMDRNNSITNPETGTSFGYGVEYNVNKKNFENDTYLDVKFSIGQILKNKKLKEMPNNSSLQEKKSDYVGKSSFKINSEKFNNGEFSIDYNYILNNDFNALLRNDIAASFNNNDSSFALTFYEESKIGNSHYMQADYQKKFDNNLSFAIGARRNLQEDFSESNYIGGNYESDCLKIGLKLAKVFYQDEELKPSNNLTFSIELKPFGAPVSPDLSSFVN